MHDMKKVGHGKNTTERHGVTDLPVAREDALTGLDKVQSRYAMPIDKRDIEAALFENGLGDDKLAAEFLAFLGTAAGAKPHARTGQKHPPASGQAVHASTGTAKDQVIEVPVNGIGALLRNFFTSLFGQTDARNPVPHQKHAANAHAKKHAASKVHDCTPPNNEASVLPVPKSLNRDPNNEASILPVSGSSFANGKHAGGCPPEMAYTFGANFEGAPLPPELNDYPSMPDFFRFTQPYGEPAPWIPVQSDRQMRADHYTLGSAAPRAILRFKSAIEDASRRTGIDANLIAAQIWAESRGNPNEKSTNPEDHRPDVGLMQISQNTYDSYVRGANRSLPRLNVNDPVQNILAGAYEVRQHILDHHGDVKAGLNAYVGEGINNKYVPNVLAFYNDLISGRTLPDQDYV